MPWPQSKLHEVNAAYPAEGLFAWCPIRGTIWRDHEEGICASPVKQGATVRSRPVFNVFGSLQREIDRLFEDFTPAFPSGRSLTDVKCKMDLAETKDGLEMTVELPGLEEKDVGVT